MTGRHDDGDFLRDVNPNSLSVLKDCAVESYVGNSPSGSRVQFERTGYFCIDSESKQGELMLNRIVTLRDTWAQPKQAPPPRKGGGKGKKTKTESKAQ